MDRMYEPSTEAFLAAYRAAGMPRVSSGAPEEARQRLTAMRQARPNTPEMVHVEDVLIPSGDSEIRGRIYVPQADCRATVVYLHGGGWVVGDLDTSDYAVRHFAQKTGARVVSVEYRLAPEHPFPAALEDAVAGLRWTADFIRRTVPAPHPLFIGGDSAGANLATVACLRARDGGGPDIAGQILIYPVVDCDFTTGSYAEYETAEPLCSADMRWFWALYEKDEARRTSPDASPLRAELSALPPAFIATAEHDPLCDEGKAYAEKLARSGVPVRHEHYAGTVHGFFSMPDVIVPAQTLLTRCAEFISALTPGD